MFSDSALPDTEIPKPQLGILSPTSHLISPIGDIISNWVFNSVSPLIGKIMEFEIEAKVKEATEGAMRRYKETEARSRKTWN